MNGESYIHVRGKIVEVRPKSVLFAVGRSVPRAGWIPRSCIHGADERSLDGAFEGEERTLRIFEWKAEALGFADCGRDENDAAEDLLDRIERDMKGER